MPDIRDILKALDDQDKLLYTQVRTEMRRAYMAAHAQLLMVSEWKAEDDAFLDIIDIKVAILFDRTGRFAALDGKGPDIAAAKVIEQQIETQAETIGAKPATNSQKILDQFGKTDNPNYTKPEHGVVTWPDK